MPMPRPFAGLGCMRLSTEPDRHESTAVAVLHAAFDGGITLLDTADAYAHDDADRGHNERLIARAIATSSSRRTSRKGSPVWTWCLSNVAAIRHPSTGR